MPGLAASNFNSLVVEQASMMQIVWIAYFLIGSFTELRIMG
jgi:hypothetical protein